MKKCYVFLAVFLMTYLSCPAFADYERHFSDLKLPTQQMVEKQNFGTPAAADTTSILSSVVGPTSAAAASVSSFAGQPDVPRNLVVTPGGTTNDVNNCVVTVSGTNFFYKPITETFSFASQQSSGITGNKAFRAVSLVSFPANCEKGGFAATWSLGKGEKIGLNKCLGSAGDWLQSSVAGAYESTRATIAASTSAVESNTADFNGTMNGSNQFLGYFMQNYLCHP